MTDRTFDAICLGRAAVDLYGEQIGGRLEDVQSFAKYLGGSSGNLAIGLARLGARVSMLTRVGNEQMGRFVRESLAAAGVDVARVRTDPDRLTGLVVLGIAGRDSFPHIFFRERCADMGLEASDVDEDHIASARLLAITGTHLSTPATAAAVMQAARAAKLHGTRVVLDIDYRPVLWGLGAAGDGENRYVESHAVTAAMAALLPLCDLIVGTEEEIRIAGGQAGTAQAIDVLRAAAAGATIVVKRGPAGCTVLPPGEASIDIAGFPVEVLNTLGAGDAFLAGFLAGVLDGANWQQSAVRGNACGALVVSRHGCSPALPTRIEIDEFLSRNPRMVRPDNDAQLRYLHLATTTRRPRNDLYVLAFDHRRQLEQLAGSLGQPLERIRRFKQLVADAVERVAASSGYPERIGVIIDERYGEEPLARMTHAGRWVGRAIEVPGSRPVEFEPRGHSGLPLLAWPQLQVVKCLVFYHPDDVPELRSSQEQRIVELWRDTVDLQRELLLEVIASASGLPVDAATVARAMQRIYNLGVRPAWWKIEPPSRAAWPQVLEVIAANDPHCNGVLLLGLDAPEDELREAFERAAPVPLCRGFAVGRSIFGASAREWMRGAVDDEAVIGDVANRYARLIDLWRGMRA